MKLANVFSFPSNLQLECACLFKQVEWDEPGCGDKQNRVSPWEVETPESLFIFPSLTAGLKRPFQPAFLGKLILCTTFGF